MAAPELQLAAPATQGSAAGGSLGELPTPSSAPATGGAAAASAAAAGPAGAQLLVTPRSDAAALSLMALQHPDAVASIPDPLYEVGSPPLPFNHSPSGVPAVVAAAQLAFRQQQYGSAAKPLHLTHDIPDPARDIPGPPGELLPSSSSHLPDIPPRSVRPHSGRIPRYPLAEFEVGQVVWAKSGLRDDPFWPAVVCDANSNLPEAVMKESTRNTIVVMFFGPPLNNKNEYKQDYAWVREGAILPFHEYIGESRCLVETKPLPPGMQHRFALAMQEALVTDAGLPPESASGQELGSPPPKRLCVRCCGCDKILKPDKGENIKKRRCTACAKAYKEGQFCPVCEKTWISYSDSDQTWVCCDNDKCGLWVHAACDNLTRDDLRDMENGRHYECPKCRKAALQARMSQSQPQLVVQAPAAAPIKIDGAVAPHFSYGPGPKSVIDPLSEENAANRVPVVCNGFRGEYLIANAKVICRCDKCKGKITFAGADFERHAGSKGKKWRKSIKVDLPSLAQPMSIGRWLENGAPKPPGSATPTAATPAKEKKDAPKKETQKKEAAKKEPAAPVELLLQPIRVRWPAERCAICFEIVDHEKNMLITCDRCLVSVHEMCYGTRLDKAQGTWQCDVCRHVPYQPQQCCLCPIAGGALKEASLAGLWAHLSCAQWITETYFENLDRMAPVCGIECIPLDRWNLTCSICKRRQGACIQCAGKNCAVPFHLSCARIAGLKLELRLKHAHKDDSELLKLAYCRRHGQLLDPWPDCPFPQYQSKPLMQLQQPAQLPPKLAYKAESPRLVLDARAMEGSTTSSDDHTEPMELLEVLLPAAKERRTGGAARCDVYRRGSKVLRMGEVVSPRKPIPQIPSGLAHHSMEELGMLMPCRVPLKETMAERVRHLHDTLRPLRVCMGKSAIHGYGLIARRPIQEGDMVIEYLGDLVRPSVADLRERRYREQGRDCYLFKVDDVQVVDATMFGDISRFINHSCQPNCYARVHPAGPQKHIVFHARHNILPGQELTYNYLFVNEDNKVPCLCGAPGCRGSMN
eukprot:jgi/Chlat1/1419/Chrsp12S00102